MSYGTRFYESPKSGFVGKKPKKFIIEPQGKKISPVPTRRRGVLATTQGGYEANAGAIINSYQFQQYINCAPSTANFHSQQVKSRKKKDISRRKGFVVTQGTSTVDPEYLLQSEMNQQMLQNQPSNTGLTRQQMAAARKTKKKISSPIGTPNTSVKRSANYPTSLQNTPIKGSKTPSTSPQNVPRPESAKPKNTCCGGFKRRIPKPKKELRNLHSLLLQQSTRSLSCRGSRITLTPKGKKSSSPTCSSRLFSSHIFITNIVPSVQSPFITELNLGIKPDKVQKVRKSVHDLLEILASVSKSVRKDIMSELESAVQQMQEEMSEESIRYKK